MGSLQASEMVQHGDVGLRWHLTNNHYPPLPETLLPVVKRVIKHARRGAWDATVNLPSGFTWKGKNYAPVSTCVEAWGKVEDHAIFPGSHK